MASQLLPLAICLPLCLALTPLVRVLARRCGLVDRPDGRRKLHRQATPLAGGLAVFASVAAALGVLVIPGLITEAPPFRAGDVLGVLLGGAVICAVGVVDDLGRLRGRHKLLGQGLAIAVVISCGVRIDTVVLFGYQVSLGLMAVPFTAFMLLGAVNSLNLLDGMDGLLSSVGAIICLAMAAMALANGQLFAAYVAFALAGALLGFLFFNFPPASVFLGDSGSMLIGLIIGVLAIQSSLKGPATFALAAPTAMLTLPILDTLAAIVRRKLTGLSIYTTDRAHLHHCLLRQGMTSRCALLLIVGFCVMAVTGALGSVAFNSELIALLSAAAVAGTLLLTGLFGHAELALVKQRLRAILLSFFRSPRQNAIKQVAVRLHGHLDWETLWVLVIGHAEELNLCSVRLDVNAPAINERYHARWDRGHDESEEDATWQAQIPLMMQGRVVAHIHVRGGRDDNPIGQRIGVLAGLVKDFEDQIAHLTDNAFNGMPARSGQFLQPAQAPVQVH
jgi:UDP-GlcNAc:undecaprenyl-phosphate GlcNAc-1-phosphate transferase